MEKKANVVNLIKRLEQSKIINLDASIRAVVDSMEGTATFDEPWDWVCFSPHLAPTRPN